MRIIAGKWKGRAIAVPAGDVTRPTGNRAREALFSMLVSRVGDFESLRVADLFAGSGALGLEALSRGAAHCGGDLPARGQAAEGDAVRLVLPPVHGEAHAGAVEEAALRIEEGSGISRDNRFTGRGLAALLSLFEPHADLLRRNAGARFKTGTFSGVSTLAGYADTTSHGRVRFVIALTSNDGAKRFQLLKTIQAGL